MIDIKFLRENPDIVKENIKKKFQDHKLPLVDEIIELDKKNREAKQNGDKLRNERKTLSSQIGTLMQNGKKEEAEKVKSEVQAINKKLDENKKVIIKTEKNLKDTVEVLISKMNINNENKKEIINLGWNNEYNKEINNDSNIIIIGTEKYIEDINNQINQNNIKDATIIDCYNFEDVKQDIKKIINEHDSSLNTLGFYDM